MKSSNSQVVDLPDRKEITLCGAVTAFIYGKGYDLRQLDRVRSDKAPIKEHAAKLNDFLEQLGEAAYSGRIKFRAIKEGEDPASGYRDIDRLYFYVKPFFNWSQDVIFHREDESATVWYFVHLDREQFASLLREMGVSVEQNLDPGALQNLDADRPTDLSSLETSGTGFRRSRESARPLRMIWQQVPLIKNSQSKS